MSRSHLLRSLASFYVVATATTAAVADPPASTPATAGAVDPSAVQDLTGRWQGRFRSSRAQRASCEGDTCNTLTLDVARCNAGWCGVRVMENGACGATAMTLAGPTMDHKELVFDGTLQLAEGTEPYSVRVSGFAATDKSPTIWLIGDTGGSLRMLRRSFPFEAQLTRQGEPACKAEQKTS